MKESYIDAIDSGNATALSIFDQGSDVIKGKLDKDVLLQEIIQELIMTIQSDSDDMALCKGFFCLVFLLVLGDINRITLRKRF